MNVRVRTADRMVLPIEHRLRPALEFAPEALLREVTDQIVAAIYTARDTSDLQPIAEALWRAKDRMASG